MKNEKLKIKKERIRSKEQGNIRFFLLLYLFFVLCSFFSCTMPESPVIEHKPYDPDLYGWRTASWTPFRDTDRIAGFAYGKINGKDRFVAVASTGIIGWSENGDQWWPANVKFENGDPVVLWNLNAVVFGNGLFVAVGNAGRYVWSNNGTDWITTEAPMESFGTENIFDIAYGAGYFVAVGGNANIAISTDGREWNSRRDNSFFGPLNAPQLNGIAFDGDNRFYVVGNGGHVGRNDGLATNNWNFRVAGESIGSNNITKVTVGRYGGNAGIGIVYNNQVAIASVADSFSGFDADLDTSLLLGNDINDITWGGSYFLIGGSTSIIGHWDSAEPSLFSSRIWRALPFAEFDRWAVTAVEALNGRFFIGNFGGKIGYSK